MPMYIGGMARACLLALGAATAGAVIAWPTSQPQPWSPSSAAAKRIAASQEEAALQPTVALFIGDSYTAGGGEVGAPYTFADLTCNEMGWVCAKDAQGGSGFIADGRVNDPSFTPYIGRLARTAGNYRPEVVIVSGGRNDAGGGGERQAAERYFTALRDAYPDAKVVALSPFWNDSHPPGPVVDVREAIRGAATRHGAVWVDTTGWLTPRLMGKDGVHPTLAGHRRLADRLLAFMRRLAG